MNWVSLKASSLVFASATLMLSAFSWSSAHELKDISLISDASQSSLKISFSGKPEEGEYPLFFQKADPSKGTVVLSFLEAETAFPLGRHAIDPGTAGVEEIQLRKTTSPSGKTFLSLELKLKEPPTGDVFVQPMPNGALQIDVGPGSKKKFSWTLSKAVKARGDYLATPAEPPPGESKQLKVAPSPNASALAPVNSRPVEPKEPGKNAGGQGSGAFKTAHEDGAALENSTGKNGLSSSKVFSVGKGNKPMIMVKDSVELKGEPNSQGNTLKKLPLGSKVVKLEGKAGWMKVVESGDTGYVRNSAAVYSDEMTEAQEKSLQKMLNAKQAKLAAIEAAAVAKANKAEAAAQAKAAKAGQQPAEPANPPPSGTPRLAIADNPELADKLAKEKKAAEDEKMRVEPEENRVTYNSYGRRDPFIPVEQGSADNGIDIDQMKVVGIIWQSSEPMAVLEHTREANVSFTVKVGDPVHNGRVSRITREAVTFDISEYGISRSYSLKLVSSKEGTKK